MHGASQDDVTAELSSAGMGGKVMGGRDQRPGTPDGKPRSYSPLP